ncbi:stalk domain-containing protein [Paenibacillus polymyxa]|nr:MULTISPECIES: stalk domain-containing protein [Paenibacillus]MEE4568441.1 stalk domain-containing protein [Paenibacillus polymyxa]
MLKRIILPLAVIFVFVSSVSVESAHAGSKFNYNVEVAVNNSVLTLDPFGEKSTNTVYVPIKFISEGLGESVSWNRPTQEVTIKSNNGTIVRLTVVAKLHT